MVQTITLAPGVTLRCFQDSRFKQSCLSFQLVRPMCEEEAASNALLPAVLLRGTSQYPDMQQITHQLDALYGASVGALVRRVGDYHTTGLYCSFLEDRYTLDGDQILAPMMDFLTQLMLDPKLENGLLPADFVESEKRNLVLTIQSQRNDKRSYASARLLDLMCSTDTMGIPRLGRESQVKAITPESLTAHYQKILQTSQVALFYVGSQTPEQLIPLLEPLVSRLASSPMTLPPQTPFTDPAGGSHTEYMEIAQGKLCVSFVTPITLRDPEFVTMRVVNAMLGGGMTSKLFMQVREKLSLCYDIGSSYQGGKGILTVSAGIDFDQREAVMEQIHLQLQALCDGNFTQAELDSARQGLITQLRSTHDSPGAIENYYTVGALGHLDLTPADYIRRLESTTPEQITAAAQTLQLHTEYFLRGQR